MKRFSQYQAATFGRGLFCALAALLLVVAASGCASPRADPTAAAPPGHSTIAASSQVIVGRVLAVDLPRLHAIVDIAIADADLPSSLGNVPLLTRTDALQTTGRLVGTDLRRGRTLGVRIVSGRPRVGDEVVWRRP